MNGVHAAVLPALSVALQVTVVIPSAKVEPGEGVQPEEEMPELSIAMNVQLAVAVGALPLLGVTVSGLVVVNGGQVSVGLIASVLTMEKLQAEDMPALSTAVQDTEVVPSGALNGDETEHVVLRMPELSVALTANGVSTFGAPPAGDTAMVLGHVMAGGQQSVTITGNEQAATLPTVSTAKHVTDVDVATVKRVPEAGQVTEATPEPSVAETWLVKATIGSGTPSAAVSAYVTFAGHVMVGGVVSVTLMKNVHEADLPHWSAAVQVTAFEPMPNVCG